MPVCRCMYYVHHGERVRTKEASQPRDARQTSGGCGFKGLVNTAQHPSALPAGRDGVKKYPVPVLRRPEFIMPPRNRPRAAQGGSSLLVPRSVWSWSCLVCDGRHGTQKSPPRGLGVRGSGLVGSCLNKASLASPRAETLQLCADIYWLQRGSATKLQCSMRSCWR